MSTENSIPVGSTGELLRSIQQTTVAGIVQTEVVVETDLAITVTPAVTVGSSDGVIVPASAGIRPTVISVPTSADTGIYVNFGAVATSASFLIEAGGALNVNTPQAIHALRAGSTNVTAYILTGVPT